MFFRESDDNALEDYSIPCGADARRRLISINDKSMTEGNSQPERRIPDSNDNGNCNDGSVDADPVADAANDIDNETRSDVTVRDSSPPPKSRDSIAELNAFFAELNTRTRGTDAWGSELPDTPKPDPRNYLPSSSFRLEHHLAGLVFWDEGAAGGGSQALQVHRPTHFEGHSLSKTGALPFQDVSARSEHATHFNTEAASRIPRSTAHPGTTKCKPNAPGLLQENITPPSTQSVAAVTRSNTSALGLPQDELPYRTCFDPAARPFWPVVDVKSNSAEKYLRDSMWASK